MCLANSIAMYSPHTAWDATLGGVNDWLANALPVKNIAPVKVRKMYTFFNFWNQWLKITRVYINELSKTALQAMCIFLKLIKADRKQMNNSVK